MKRKSNDLTTQTLLDFDYLDESSSDSDFRIEDHDDDSDDCSVNSKDADNDSNDDSDNSDSDGESDSEFSATQGKAKKFKANPVEEKEQQIVNTTKILDTALIGNINDKVNIKLLVKPICCACLGDRSDDINEIVECDGCGVTVHEGCYGVSDSASISSTVSSCSTEPWFCEACKAGVTDPHCELCPNKGGIFKETDVGKWVHLVCALYVPGVAFGEVDQLSSVTLFEMPYNKWGAKTCSLCDDARFSRSGVCIGCDAGMCKTYFHVTW